VLSMKSSIFSTETNHHISFVIFLAVSVTNVKQTKSILLSKEKLCPYVHESLEHHGSPWKLTVANTRRWRWRVKTRG
jgi:hypothetical protein